MAKSRKRKSIRRYNHNYRDSFIKLVLLLVLLSVGEWLYQQKDTIFGESEARTI